MLRDRPTPKAPPRSFSYQRVPTPSPYHFSCGWSPELSRIAWCSFQTLVLLSPSALGARSGVFQVPSKEITMFLLIGLAPCARDRTGPVLHAPALGRWMERA